MTVGWKVTVTWKNDEVSQAEFDDFQQMISWLDVRQGQYSAFFSAKIKGEIKTA